MTNERLIESIVFSSSRQAKDYREIFEYNKNKFKISIRSDSVDTQSYARIYVLDNLNWDILYDIPFDLMKTEKQLAYVSREVKAKDFAKDVNRLKEVMKEIIG